MDYSGKQRVTIGSTNEFSYTLRECTRKTFLWDYLTCISYKTDSLTAYGAISDFEIVSKGNNYYSLPGISTINTEVGTGAIIEAREHFLVGKIKKLKS